MTPMLGRVQFQIDPQSPTPISQQLVAQVHLAVAESKLLPGTRLPTVRGLATQLGIAPNTVAKAFRELESAGTIETRGRSGSFVRGAGQEQAARQAASHYAQTARDLGLDLAQALTLVRNSW